MICILLIQGFEILMYILHFSWRKPMQEKQQIVYFKVKIGYSILNMLPMRVMPQLD